MQASCIYLNEIVYLDEIRTVFNDVITELILSDDTWTPRSDDKAMISISYCFN